MPPLSGKTVLITRAPEQADELAGLLQSAGASVASAPSIRISPPESWEAVDRAIDSIYMYDGLIFTSTNGVRFFLDRCRALNIPSSALASKSICVVGQKTRGEVEQAGLNVTTMPDTFTAADLGRTLRQDDLHGKSFLHPRGNLGKDVLSAMLRTLGASVDGVIVYRTLPPNPADVAGIRNLIATTSMDCVIFTSPSTFLNFASMLTPDGLRSFLHDTRIASIGPVTSREISAAGFDVDIQPARSTMPELVQAIIGFFQSTT